MFISLLGACVALHRDMARTRVCVHWLAQIEKISSDSAGVHFGESPPVENLRNVRMTLNMMMSLAKQLILAGTLILLRTSSRLRAVLSFEDSRLP